MEVTFLLSLDVPAIDPLSLQTEAQDISDALISKGHDVISCKPWARANIPTIAPAGGFTSLTQPTIPPTSS